ncbi:ABC transporter substrate-binding protein [Devosia sp. A16]|uniref:ABC transporter substrate-binding protein n=1 Tax=Devosia sp. A16 TaxID=1736675 RepID=UPI0009EC2DCC|nr:ABC transporter substrate-binding protein [Devosia sp. A16]
MTKFTRSLSGVAFAAMTLMASGQAMAQTVSWWYEALTPEQQKLLDDKLVGGFAASHPGVTLELEYRGNAVENQQRLALMSGGGPDIINSNGPATALATAKAGQLLALDDYAAKLGWDKRLIPMFLSLGKVDGVLYSIPKNYEAMGLFYNADIFAAKGWTAPKTVAEMEALADTMLAEGMTPFVAGNAGFRPANEQFFTVALNQLAGPAAIREALAGTRPWTDPVFVEAMTRFKAWYDKGYYGKDYFSTSTIDAFAGMVTGKTGMAPQGTWAFSWVKDYFDPAGANAAFTSIPVAEGVPYPLFPIGVGSALSINAKSANPDAAAQVIDYIFSGDFYGAVVPQWQGEWNVPLADLSGIAMQGEVTPLYKEATTMIADAIADGSYGYTTWTFWPPRSEQYIISGVEELWLNKATPEQFLAGLQEIFAGELAEGSVPPLP